MTFAWVDATGGVSGDMLLGACLDAGASLEVVRSALDALALPETVEVSVARATRSTIDAARAEVRVGAAQHHRGLADVLALLDALAEPVRTRAGEVFGTLAAAEARVHGVGVQDVHFHEVGALDSIADVVGVLAAVESLGIERLTCSPIALGGGRARTEHGVMPVPVPAVLELLAGAGAPGFGGPVDVELATPTAVALLVTLAEVFGPMPVMRPAAIGVGAGARDPEGHANVVRIVLGEAVDQPGTALVVEANVDDLDPRLWPGVLADLLDAGALDAWLSPITMKKGRPAHTLSVLAPHRLVDAVERLVLTRTSTIGVRRHAVDRHVLPREIVTVEVFGAPVRVKLARLDGDVVNAVPEFEDVARVAVELGLPEKSVLAAAIAALG